MSSNCARAAEPAPHSATLESLFDACFLASEYTTLRGGADEPLYTPAGGGQPAVIRYRYDYPASALHEVAHWCIAGAERRKQIDYGYWYSPDGRDAQQQRAFIDVEARPQALEWIFSRACGLSFQPSLDNLEAPPDSAAQALFFERIAAAARVWIEGGLNPRAARFRDALEERYEPPQSICLAPFEVGALQ